MVTHREEGGSAARLTVEDYHRLVPAGVLGPEARVELLQGEVVEMPPIGPGHAEVVSALHRLLLEAAGRRYEVRSQNPLALDAWNEPQPDVMLLRQRPGGYWSAHPGPADVLLVVEVAERSLARDLGVKLPLYARFGLPEVWLVDLPGRALLRCLEPGPGAYGSVRTLGLDAMLTPVQAPELRVELGDLGVAGARR